MAPVGVLFELVLLFGFVTGTWVPETMELDVDVP